MTISLVRHGRPAADLVTRIAGRDFAGWLDAYDAAGIDRSLPPPASLREVLSGVAPLFCSPTLRAVESANLLAAGLTPTPLPAAREVPLPRQVFCPLRVPPVWLTVLARILWNCRFARAAETPAAATHRARALTAELIHLARDH